MINIEINSKLIKKGDTFVALKGTITDGHKYIQNAIDNGATTVVVSNSKTYSVNTINVDNTDDYLTNLLVEKYAKEFEDLKIIGITGTNGKTTIGYMTYQLLRKLKMKVAYIGTLGFYYNDQKESTLNTTPDILSLYKYLIKAKEEKCNIVLIEASSIGLYENRMKGLKFDAAVFTNLTHDHLDYHKNMRNYMLAKKILFNNLKENGLSIINNDDKYKSNFITPNTITYGFENDDITCVEYNDDYSEFKCVYKEELYSIKSPLFGKYNIYNTMAILGILIHLNVNIQKACKLLEKLTPPPGRINIIDYNTNKIIIDYAHTPDGIKQVLNSAKHMQPGKVYVIFGCPGNRDRRKRPMMGKIVEKGSDYFIVTNDDPHYEDPMQIINDTVKELKSNNYETIPDRKEAIKKGLSLLTKNDTLLILGKGHEDAIIIKDQRIPHNDKQFVEEWIKKTVGIK